MSVAASFETAYVGPEDYLAAERVSEMKHEYLAGSIFALVGSTRTHGRITSNILVGLATRRRKSKCEPLGFGVLLRIQRPGLTFYYYPDVTIDCSGSNEDELTEPTVIFEVLSRETERADRGDKLLNYQSIPSMRAYVLVDQYRAAVTVYRRRGDGTWAAEFIAELAGSVELPDVGASLPLEKIYAGVF